MDASDLIAMSKPARGEAGRTGDWRSARPVVDASVCIAATQGRITCQICWAHCPDACIEQGAPPVIDLEFCKGCGICADVCPAHAVAMVPEAEHGVCEAAEGGDR